MIRFRRLGPSAAAMPIARMKPGNAESMSITRMPTSSSAPPTNPATAPTVQPSRRPIATAQKPISRS